MWQEIERLAPEEQMTILLTTHYMEEADRLASQLAIIDRGRIVAEGAPEALKSELEGDTIQVELPSGEDARARSALARVADVERGRARRRSTLRARARDGARRDPRRARRARSHGVKAASVTLARPSLDEVYLRHAGRAFAARPSARHEEVAA